MSPPPAAAAASGSRHACRRGVRVPVRGDCVRPLVWPVGSVSLVSVRLSLSTRVSGLLPSGLARTLPPPRQPGRRAHKRARVPRPARRDRYPGGHHRRPGLPMPPASGAWARRTPTAARARPLASRRAGSGAGACSGRPAAGRQRACPEPSPRSPAGAAGGQPAPRLGGGGAACARAQTRWRPGARRAEEKAAAGGGGLAAGAAGG